MQRCRIPTDEATHRTVLRAYRNSESHTIAETVETTGLSKRCVSWHLMWVRLQEALQGVSLRGARKRKRRK